MSGPGGDPAGGHPLIYGTTVPFLSHLPYTHCVDFVRPIESVIPGAQGRLLGALARVEAPLNLRRLAQVSRVSLAQASRVLPDLVELGLVRRTDVPPAALFELDRRNVAAQTIAALERLGDSVIAGMTRAAEEIDPSPESIILFGSMARGEARAESDIDVLVIRPTDVSNVDEGWSESVQQWIDRVRTLTGNAVNLLELDRHEATQRLRSNRSPWRSIATEGIVLSGRSLEDLTGRRSA